MGEVWWDQEHRPEAVEPVSFAAVFTISERNTGQMRLLLLCFFFFWGGGKKARKSRDPQLLCLPTLEPFLLCV